MTINKSHLDLGEERISPERANLYLKKWRDGDADAFNQVIEILHDDLKRIAHRQFGRERMNHTLQTDDLVHKLYIKLLGAPNRDWTEHSHFLNAASRAMRQILIDHARVWGRRADGKGKVELEERDVFAAAGGATLLDDLITIDKAVKELDAMDPTMSKIADMKLVLGLTLSEISEQLNLDLSRVKREWVLIKKFLGQKMKKGYSSSRR